MRNADAGLLKQLSAGSSPYRDPIEHIDWHTLDIDSFWLPECALSLYGLPAYDALPIDIRRRLSQYEFINVMQCGLWLESVFLQRLTRKLEPALARDEYEYLLHEVREEAGHGLMFLKAIESSGLPVPQGAWRAPPLAAALARWLPVGGDLFWLGMVIGEDVPDSFNRWLRGKHPLLHPVVRQICTLHVVDEARHISYARSKLAQPPRNRNGRPLMRAVARLLLAQIADVFYFPPARFYELAGLSDAAHWRELALASPLRQRFVAERLEPTRVLLERYRLAAGR